ncbi:MAG: T9SS type A sorting domain-containing protein [Flavobacteriales bacterium]|nr:T9SS type A sorting domain-containing protein [Flavobacteriales bacterium]
MKQFLTLVLFACSSAANAVTVSIGVDNQPTCAYANGSIYASASGGVGPYTYLWSPGGETTSLIANLAPGTYSVTVTDANSDQATDQVTITSQPYVVTTGYPNEPGLCQGWSTVTINPSTTPTMIPGPPPYYMDGAPMMELMPSPETNWMLLYTTQFFPTNGYGQAYTFSFEDGNGCTGTINGWSGWPLEWPEVTILDVQGACSGSNNGTVTYQTGLEGHSQMTQVYVTGANPSATNYMGFYVGTFTATGLAAGDHWIRHYTDQNIWSPGFGCADSVLFTVPDLGNGCANMSGSVFVDDNENCTRQGNEPFVPGALLEIIPGPYYTLTNANGVYSINLPLGNYTVEHQSAILDEHCAGVPIPFDLTGNVTGIDHPDTSLVPLDAMITGANSPARPGFQFHVALEIANLTPVATGTTSTVFTFDPLLSYVSSSPNGSVAGNTVTWNQTSLNAFQERMVHVYLQVPPDIGLLGTTLNNSATVTTANADANTTNNTMLLPVLVTGAYDPNDKLAHTRSGYSDALYYIDVDEWIDYTIRFQNTGTDTAFNIVVTDTIAPELDLATLVPSAASHAHEFSIRNGNVLRYAFNNIQLPDSNVNEPRSHGFLSFRIRPSQPLVPGTTIENIANIYFDFNPPVITDPSVLVAEFSTGVQQQDQSQLSLAPNPASDHIRLSMKGTLANSQWVILAVDGRMVSTGYVGADQPNIDIGSLASGTYLLRLLSTDRTLTTTFVKTANP